VADGRCLRPRDRVRPARLPVCRQPVGVFSGPRAGPQQTYGLAVSTDACGPAGGLLALYGMSAGRMARPTTYDRDD
jgi:hypothetical protein